VITQKLQSITVSSIFLCLVSIIIWREQRAKILEREVIALRAQAEAAASLPEANQKPLSAPQLNTEQSLAQDQFRELLRLRGEVGILRVQLADATKLMAGKEAREPATNHSPQELRLMDADKTLDVAYQGLGRLAATLNLPMRENPESPISAEYLRLLAARRRCEELENFNRILKLKILDSQ
jgi:hypothetical protein